MGETHYSYQFENGVRDLKDILSTVIAQQPRFLQLFAEREAATSRKHEWLEDQISGDRVTVNGAVSDSKVPVSATDLAKLRVGMLFHIAEDNALFRITAIDDSNNKATVTRVSANGSATTAPSNGDVLIIVSTPEKEGTKEGENKVHQSGVAFNYTQIFRKDVILSGTAIQSRVYGLENQINYQVNHRMIDFARDLNFTAIFGSPVQASNSANGAAGGLLYYGTQSGGLYVDANSTPFDSFLVNDAAALISGQGGTPGVIVCGLGQARVLSADMRDKITIVQQDSARGAYVANIINDVNGSGIRIFAEPGIPDNEAFVVDPAGFGLVPMNGRSVWDEDSTAKGFDGISRTIIGEYTFEFKNALQRICWIKNLQASSTALASKRQGLSRVNVISSEDDPVYTAAVTGATV